MLPFAGVSLCMPDAGRGSSFISGSVSRISLTRFQEAVPRDIVWMTMTSMRMPWNRSVV